MDALHIDLFVVGDLVTKPIWDKRYYGKIV